MLERRLYLWLPQAQAPFFGDPSRQQVPGAAGRMLLAGRQIDLAETSRAAYSAMPRFTRPRLPPRDKAVHPGTPRRIRPPPRPESPDRVRALLRLVPLAGTWPGAIASDSRGIRREA